MGVLFIISVVAALVLGAMFVDNILAEPWPAERKAAAMASMLIILVVWFLIIVAL